MSKEKPASPTGPLSTKDITTDSVTLTWQPPASDGGSAIKGYLVEKYDSRRMTWVKVADIDEKTTSYIVPKLIEGQKYKFRVSALNAEGQGQPLETEGDVVPRKPPAAPEKPSGPIKFSNILGDSVTLTWSPPKKDGGAPVKSYNVERSVDNGKTWEKVENIDTTKYTVTGLKAGDKYKFRVAAVNELGEGDMLVSEAVVPQRPTGNEI